MSEPLSISRWFRGLVIVGNVGSRYCRLLDDHHEVGDPGQQFSGGFIWSHGQIRKPLDDLLVIGLCRKLFLEPWFQIRPGELSICPVQHVSRCKEPLSSKAFESIGDVRISSGVGPVVCSCQILNFPDKNDSCDRILGFLSPEFWYLCIGSDISIKSLKT